MLDEIRVVLGVGTADAFATAALGAVGGDGSALDVTAVRDGDDGGFVGDEVLDLDLAFIGNNVGAPGVAVLLAEFLKLLFDDAPYLRGR
ncbi:MAG: hypothetical protein NTY01_03860 [Verrucomicrobia bacterium]|nr:hypothetical protein [Verrucomicrobiota bacterium]